MLLNAVYKLPASARIQERQNGTSDGNDIGIGVPTVVGAGTIVHDAVAGVLESLEESEMDEFLGEVISPALESLYVTTKEIDEMVRRLAGVLAAGMNQAFSGEL